MTVHAKVTPTTTTGSPPPEPPLPVLIAGAGPCGLVAALAIRQYGVPFRIVERASRRRLCSNAGSGFELAPTSCEILRHRLGVDVSKLMNKYAGMRSVTTEGGRLINQWTDMDYEGGSVNRADLQKHLLGLLFPSPMDEDGVLVCGSGIENYVEDDARGSVTVTLQNGETMTGCALLACDGIHSRCRAVMHGAARDPLRFCNAVCYWGKTPAPEGSDLRAEFDKHQKATGADGEEIHCTGPVMSFPTRKAPAGFFVFPSEGGRVLNWAVTVRSKTPNFIQSNDGTDLTRRGGGALTDADKRKYFDFTNHGKDSVSIVRGITDFPLLQQLIANTPAADMTEASLFDRENLDLPFSSESKLVALLGDAAHPQTPYLGQGVNMSICDAYVYATNLALALAPPTPKKTIQTAMAECDTEARRKSSKQTVQGARIMCDMFTSNNLFWLPVARLSMKLMSTDAAMKGVAASDTSNRDYLKYLDQQLCSVQDQEAMRKIESS